MQLSKNWFIDKKSDFECLKYTVLAYLQEVGKDYDQNIIQPHLSNLSDLYNDAHVCIKNIEFVDDVNSGIIGINLVQKIFFKENATPKNKLFEDIQRILDYAIPKFDKYITRGRKLENELSKFIKLENLPVSPINRDSGMLFLKENDNIKVYSYTKIDGEVIVEFTETVTSIGSSMNNVKSLYQEKNGSVACVYVVSSEIIMPSETMVYLASRKLLNFLSDK